MRVENRIHINAPVDTIYRLAVDILSWPELLPHYRYVRPIDVVDGNGRDNARVVRMGARRGPVPVHWTALQTPLPECGRISYRHVGGVTKGMEVVWTISPADSGAEVTIFHELSSPRWWLRLGLTQFIVGQWFVAAIAAKTLAAIKWHAEGGT